MSDLSVRLRKIADEVWDLGEHSDDPQVRADLKGLSSKIHDEARKIARR